MPWKRPAKPAEAYLVRLKEDGQPMTAPPIPISTPEMTFGSDPLQVTRILDDPSVSPCMPGCGRRMENISFRMKNPLPGRG